MRLVDVARALVAPIRTSAGWAGLLHAGLTLLASLAILGTVYFVTAGYERRATEEAIATEVRALDASQAEGGLAGLARQVAVRTAADSSHRGIFALLDHNGRVVAGNLSRFAPIPGWQSFRIPDGEHEGDRGLGLGVALADGGVLFVGRHQGQLEELEERIVRAILIAGAVAILLSVAGGVLLGRSVQRRAVGMNRALMAIAEGDLARRLPARPNGDEFDSLAESVNATLERLQGAVARLNQVTGDIAHDLRTPLSHLRQRLERASRNARDGTVPRNVVDRAVADVDDVLGIFAALLRIAQIESGERHSSFADVDLSAALYDVIDALAPRLRKPAGR